MINYITRIAGLMLAFGFFFSCSTLFNAKSKKPASPEQYSEKQLRKKIESVDKQLETAKKSPILLYNKGYYLTELAQKQPAPDRRTPFYFRAQQSLKEAYELYGSASRNEEQEKIHQLLKVNWSHEHNQGVQIIQRDSSLDGTDYNRAASHFNNATVIIPDSSISYEMQAQAYYKNQQPQQAIKVLEKARRNIEELPVSLLQQLGFLYSEVNQPQKAISVYEQATSISDENLNLLHGLLNAYIATDQHKKAVELLQLLTKNKPANIIYGQGLATELYQLGAEKIEAVKSTLERGAKLKYSEFTMIDSLLEKAENEFSQVMQKNTGDEEFKRRFAFFYQNSAAKLQQLVPLLSKTRGQSTKKTIERFLSKSIPLLKQLSEENPEDQEIWKNLYQTYSYLGMRQEALEIKEKANI